MNSGVRVLHLVSVPQLTGAAEPAIDLVRSLRALGAEVDLRIDTRRQGNLRGLLEAAGEAVQDDLTLSTKAGLIATSRDVAGLRRLMPAYDVVHTHLSNDHMLATFASFGARGGPAIVRTVHSDRVLGAAPWRGWILRQADGVTVACEAHQRRVVEVHGVEAERVLVLGGSVDTARFHPDAEARARVRSALGLGAGEFAAGSIARFQAGRRHEVMLDAVARLPDVRLVLIGHGETQPMLRTRAAAPDLEGRVIFAGYRRDDLNDYLCALDAALWLVPGNDATSRAVLQAMAAGVPVIGGAAGAISDAVVPGGTGLLVDPDDPAAVASALAEIASDRGRARAMAERGVERVREIYSPQARGRAALDFYRRLLALGARR